MGRWPQTLPTNVVERTDIRDLGFPGDAVNFNRRASSSGPMYPAPLSELMYQLPLDDEFYEGISGFLLEQIDAADLSIFETEFEVKFADAQLVLYTQADATYRWFLRKIPQGIGTLVTDVADPVTTDGGDHIELDFSTSKDNSAEGWHPYAPNEHVTLGFYKARLEMASLDGTTKGIVNDIDVVLDYPDVFWQGEDVDVPAGGTRVSFPPDTFRKLKAVNLTVQDDSFAPGAAVNAIVELKDRDFVDIRTIDAAGNDVAGVVDVTAVGY